MRMKRLIGGLLAAALLCNTASALPQLKPGMLHASAADGRLYNQWDEQWKNVVFTKYSKGGNSLYTSACGMFSFCNAIYALNSRKVDVVEFSTWAVEIGALRPGAGGTYRDILYKHVEEKWGEEFGFTIAAQGLGTVRDQMFIDHLKNGGVAVLYVPGHFIAVTGYDELYQTYQVIESAVSGTRGLQPVSWVNADKLTSGGTNGTWYVLLSNTKAPDHAEAAIPRTLYGVGEEIDLTVDSNTRNQYRVRFYDDQEQEIADLGLDQTARSSTQHFICSLSYAGDYSCVFDGSNPNGTVKSEPVKFRIYDQKPSGVSAKLLTDYCETGKPSRFRVAGSPAAGYTLNIADADGKTVLEQYVPDMLDGETLKSSETEWTPEFPGEYTYTATLANFFGDVTTKAVPFTVYGDVEVRLDANGGTLDAAEPVAVPYAGRYGTLPVPVRDNHRFDGWFTAAEGGEPVTAETVMDKSLPHTLYAHWTKVLETGDINGDHKVNVMDAQIAVIDYVTQMSGQETTLDAAELKAADVNGDGKLSVDDAQNILIYYVRNSVASDAVTWEELFAEQAAAETATTPAVTTTTMPVTTTTVTTTVTTSTAKATTSTTKATTSATKATTSTTKATTSTTKAATSTTKATASTTKAATSTTKATASTTKAATAETTVSAASAVTTTAPVTTTAAAS